MKTVGDFKKAGLVFVEGDLCKDCNDGDVYGREGDKSEWVERVNNGLTLFNSDTITEFAWRANTGVKPEFSGMIEVEYYFNHKDFGTKVVHSDCLDWEQLTLFKKWRPHLPAAIQTETPEEKEAFEAMNKSPYDVDAHVSDASKDESAQWQVFHGESWVNCIRFGLDIYGNHAYQLSEGEFKGEFNGDPDGGSFRVKPIKTEREKAIEEITGEWPHACKSTIELMLDAGYTKEKK